MKIARVSVLALLFMATFTEDVEAISVRDKILSLKSKKVHGDGPSGENWNPELANKEEKDDKKSEDKKESYEEELKNDAKDSQAKKSADETAAAATMKEAKKVEESKVPVFDKNGLVDHYKDASGNIPKGDGLNKHGNDAAGNLPKGSDEHALEPVKVKNLDKNVKDAPGKIPTAAEKAMGGPSPPPPLGMNPHLGGNGTNSTGDGNELQRFLSRELHNFSAEQYSTLKKELGKQSQEMREALLNEKEDFKKSLENQRQLVMGAIARKTVDPRPFHSQHKERMSLLNYINNRHYEIHEEVHQRK